jgi:suppressor of fused
MSETGEQPKPSAPGWEAIDARLSELYPGQPLQNYGPLLSRRLGGSDPLDGLAAFKRLVPKPHWNFVTYGFSDLYEKTGSDPAVSGLGFELTLRLLCAAEEFEPQKWGLAFIQDIGRYVFATGSRFAAGDHMALKEPMGPRPDGTIVALAFTADRDLPRLEGPNGGVDFIQMVGLTADEFLAAKRWNAAGVVDMLARSNPRLITDPRRRSILENAALRSEVDAKAVEEGSSTGSLFNNATSFTLEKRLLRRSKVMGHLGHAPAREAAQVLAGRVPFGRSLTLAGTTQKIVFEPADTAQWSVDGETTLRIGLDRSQAVVLSLALGRGPGQFTVPGLEGLRFEVIDDAPAPPAAAEPEPAS